MLNELFALIDEMDAISLVTSISDAITAAESAGVEFDEEVIDFLAWMTAEAICGNKEPLKLAALAVVADCVE